MAKWLTQFNSGRYLYVSMKKYLVKYGLQLSITVLAIISTVCGLLEVFGFKGDWRSIFSVWWVCGFLWASIPVSKYYGKKPYLMLVWVVILFAGLLFASPTLPTLIISGIGVLSVAITVIVIKSTQMGNIRVYMMDTMQLKQWHEKNESIHFGMEQDDLLRQIAILRWGNDESKLDGWVNRLQNDPFGFVSFYAFAIKDGLKDGIRKKNGKVIGFAYFCQDENNENHWYYGDLVVSIRRSGVATRMVEMAMLELRQRKASKLFTYIDKDNKPSTLFHEKLSFAPSEKQESINGFDKDNRVVYERTL